MVTRIICDADILVQRYRVLKGLYAANRRRNLYFTIVNLFKERTTMTRILAMLVCAALCASLIGWQAHAQDKKDDKKQEERKDEKKKNDKKVEKKPAMPPTLTIAYGEHPRQVMDFYKATSDKPTPLVFYIHGGGWRGGDKTSINPKPFLDAGISVVAINYRYTQQAEKDNVVPPVWARPGRSSSSGPRRPNGTSTRNASAPPAAPPAHAPRCGSPSTTTWPSLAAPTRSRANRRASGARPSTAPRPPSIRCRSRNGCPITRMARTPSA
jgi:hypothetical protein